MTFEVQYVKAQWMAEQHDDVSESIIAHADTIIDSLNGGVGGEFILNALANLGELAGEVAQVNTAAANRLRTTVDEVQGIDDEAATDFRLLEESVP